MRKDELRKEINRLANKLAHLTGTGNDAIHRSWIRQMKDAPHGTATKEELTTKAEWLENKISEFYRRNTTCDKSAAIHHPHGGRHGAKRKKTWRRNGAGGVLRD